jgi:hypothetical protein
MPWIIDGLRANGGRVHFIEVAKHIWKHHRKEIEASGDFFYKWQYELRWAANQLVRDNKIRKSDRQAFGNSLSNSRSHRFHVRDEFDRIVTDQGQSHKPVVSLSIARIGVAGPADRARTRPAQRRRRRLERLLFPLFPCNTADAVVRKLNGAI